jgi:hypothetical protein
VRVRPLAGGFHGWVALGYPVVSLPGRDATLTGSKP